MVAEFIQILTYAVQVFELHLNASHCTENACQEEQAPALTAVHMQASEISCSSIWQQA